MGEATRRIRLSQAATDVLAGETGIPAWNLADFVTRVTHDALRTTDGTPVAIGPRTVILVDEAGTVDSRTWHAFTRICREGRVAGVRVLGDPDQTQPVGSGSLLGWLARHLPTTYLTENRRQGLGGVEVVSRLNGEARSRYRSLGRLDDGGVVIAGRAWAVGDRVVFVQPHRVRVPAAPGSEGRAERRRSGTRGGGHGSNPLPR